MMSANLICFHTETTVFRGVSVARGRLLQRWWLPISGRSLKNLVLIEFSLISKLVWGKPLKGLF